MRTLLALLIFLLSTHAAVAQCNGINLDGTYLESYSQNPSLTDAETHLAGSVSRRIWRFSLGQVTVAEQFLDSKACDLNDSKCTYFQVAVDFKTQFTPDSCTVELEALNRQETYLRSYGQPENEHYETIRHYSSGEKQASFTAQTQGKKLSFWSNGRETLLQKAD